MPPTALLLIDLQEANFSYQPPIAEGQHLLDQASLLLQRARQTGVPVIFIQNDGPSDGIDAPFTPGWEIHPSLTPLPGEIVIRKTTPDSFYKTELHDRLQALGVQTLIVAGLQTEFCIDTSVRSAFSHGYHVILVQDAHSTWDSTPLTALQIIEHHNGVLGAVFAELQPAEAVQFSA